MPENGQAAEAAEAPGPVFFPLPHSQALHGGNLAKFQVRLHSFIHFHLFPSVSICFHPDPFRLFPSVSEFPSPFISNHFSSSSPMVLVVERERFTQLSHSH